MKFSIEIAYTDIKYEEFDDIDDIDEDDLMSYCEDIDDDRIYDTTLSLVINDKEHKLTAEEFNAKKQEALRSSEGNVIVVTDERGYRFDDFPNDYGEEASWFCESLRKDIESNSVVLEEFKYHDGIWSYKDDGIDAYITCDMSSEESVTVFVDGDEVMSA